MKKILFLIIFCLYAYPLAISANKDKENTPELFVECLLNATNCYERQPIPAVITLFSSTPDVVKANLICEPRLNKGEFATFQPIKPAGSPYTVKRNDKIYYCIPLSAFMFSMPEKGKFSLEGASYNIGIQIPTIYNDPFWGPIRSRKVEEYKVNMKKVSFSVKTLPVPPSDFDFSGSVGNFTIKTIIPQGDIVINEPSTAIIVLKGTGMIAENTMPVYIDAFKDGLSLKSVQESRTAAYDKGKMVSELHLECTFIPTRIEDCKIGEIYFDYFDPDSGKYVRASSQPVSITVKSSVTKRQHMEI